MREIYATLPVRNLKVAAAFFAEIGFTVSPAAAGPGAACLDFGPEARILLLGHGGSGEQAGGGGAGGPQAADADAAGADVTSLPAGSAQEVDEIVAKAIAAGGRPWPIMEERPVYSGSFQDLDGHVWQFVCPLQ